MKIIRKTTYLIIFLLITHHVLYAQSEYRYFGLRFGFNHNFLNPKPEAATDKFLTTPDGDMRIFPIQDEEMLGGASKTYIDYNVGFTGDVQYHFDFKNDKVGLIFGVQYATNGISAKYLARPGTLEEIQNSENNPPSYIYNDDYWVVEKNRVYSVGVPLALKFGKDIYSEQFYFFLGGQYNLNLFRTQTHKVGWGAESYKTKSSDGITSGNIQVFAGINYLIFNLEFNYMMGTFLDETYRDPNGFLPFRDQPKGAWGVKTSIYIPLSEWLVLKSWSAEKIRRKFKFD